MKRLFLLAIAGLIAISVTAQRVTDSTYRIYTDDTCKCYIVLGKFVDKEGKKIRLESTQLTMSEAYALWEERNSQFPGLFKIRDVCWQLQPVIGTVWYETMYSYQNGQWWSSQISWILPPGNF